MDADQEKGGAIVVQTTAGHDFRRPVYADERRRVLCGRERWGREGVNAEMENEGARPLDENSCFKVLPILKPCQLL